MLTLYYMVTSIIHGWRLRLLAARIRRLITLNSSLVLYKEMKVVAFLGNSGLTSEMRGISSKCCFNKYQARLGELIWCIGNKRAITVFPKQRIDLTNWIGFPGVGANFAFDDSQLDVSLEENNSISIIIETNYAHSPLHDETKFCEFQVYGSLQAWKMGAYFSLLLETDAPRLAKLGVDFMLDRILIEDIELIRIESVTVEGHPYITGYTSPVPVRRYLGYSHLPFVSDLGNAACQNFLKRNRLPSAERINCISSERHFLYCNQINCNTVFCSDDEQACSTRKTGIFSSQSLSVESAESASEETCSMLEGKKDSNNPLNNLDEHKEQNMNMKPPNVLIVSESVIARNNIKDMLYNVLNKNRYTVYTTTQEQLLIQPWMDNTRLLVVSGNVSHELGSRVINYLLQGGKVLCLCSDLLHLMLPMFRTAEVRERELVQFSYGQWKHVSLMHHIFCYQPSPEHRRFFRFEDLRRNPPEKLPSVVLVYDENRVPHELQIEILGAEETWHTPSLIMATAAASGGRFIFSQVHLEIDPQQYEQEKEKFRTLQASDSARLAILRDLLSVHLGIECSLSDTVPHYKPGYLLGRSEVKECFLKYLFQKDNILRLPKLDLRVYKTELEPAAATEKFLPVFMYGTPHGFSEIEYFQALKTKVLGQVVLYTEVMTSSMDVLEGAELLDGLAVVTHRQTRGKGRSGNTWISPEGCAVFSVHLHISRSSYLGQHLLLVQHLAGLAIVSSICSLPGYENLNLRLKWPNDIYVGSTVKIGGVLVTSSYHQNFIICNIGCGINLNNEAPTTCINALINEYKQRANETIQLLSLEKYLAGVFNRLEELLERVQSGNITEFLDLYYTYWLHSDAKITVTDTDGACHDVTVLGIDDYGFIVVRNHFGNCFSVHPGDNSFDLFRGMIIPKHSVQ
ncbi:biotin--protein ligase isoform X1 [Schistocerca gregaria]|uniref:biotin--protein ligase isoform X1 n=1 Tax=Schistocerca gregaria TaxID=7010 RepID=UPI00211E9D68|nr:biotin--protein ligase isoform X1 [Schistocerca gregaria]XP_049844577.1 biotin--protein ligase isoform X1 [Schistocerca gregaria]XP_049844578.1 biotin--protein ligase isoform X1 [Schistocerca gregaria]XP_049844579.1 biotin--protein ligase isoform X1 [Schistocerca gregaria]